MSERHLLALCMDSEAVSGRVADSTELGAGFRPSEHIGTWESLRTWWMRHLRGTVRKVGRPSA